MIVTVFDGERTQCLKDGILHWGCGYNCHFKGCQRRLWEGMVARTCYVYITKNLRGGETVLLSWDDPLTADMKKHLTIEWPIGWDYALPEGRTTGLDQLLALYHRLKARGRLPQRPAKVIA